MIAESFTKLITFAIYSLGLSQYGVQFTWNLYLRDRTTFFLFPRCVQCCKKLMKFPQWIMCIALSKRIFAQGILTTVLQRYSTYTSSLWYETGLRCVLSNNISNLFQTFTNLALFLWHYAFQCDGFEVLPYPVLSIDVAIMSTIHFSTVQMRLLLTSKSSYYWIMTAFAS